jgi:hypothetical protein
MHTSDLEAFGPLFPRKKTTENPKRVIGSKYQFQIESATSGAKNCAETSDDSGGHTDQRASLLPTCIYHRSSLNRFACGKILA